MGFKGETVKNKDYRENFDELLAIRQSLPPSNFCTIWYIKYDKEANEA